MLCRRSRAAASSAATRLATQLLACGASPWRPHPLQAGHCEDKTPSRRGKSLFPLNPEADELPVLPEFVLLAPFQATREPPAAPPRTPQPFAPPWQALTCPSPQPSHSSPIPAETPPWTFHRGQPHSEPLRCHFLLR